MKLKINFRKLTKFCGFQRALMSVVCMIAFVFESFAASGPFAKAVETISGYKSDVKDIIYAVAAVVALVSAFNIFFKMNNGDQDVKKTIMLSVGGCIALIALAEALPAFF